MSEERGFVGTGLALIAAFGAVAILLGYVFEAGFALSFDSRLFQFFSAQDYVSAATTYIFIVPVVGIVAGSNLVGLMRHDRTSAGWKLLQDILNFDGELEVSLRNRISKLSRWMLIAPLIFVLFGGAITFLMPHNYWPRANGVGDALSIIGIVTVLIPAGLLSTRDFVHARNRRGLLLCTFAVAVFAGVFFYGQFEGGKLKDRTKPNFAMEIKGGHRVAAVMVAKLADGIVYKFVAEKNLYYVPNDEIAAIELLQ
jgi:hypothetical protein